MTAKDHAPNDWLRLYTDVLRDTKLAQLPPSARWCWIGLLVLATESPEPGRLVGGDGLPLTVAGIASTCGLDARETKQALVVFHQESMLHRDGKVIVVTNFLKRQPRVRLWLEGRGPAFTSRGRSFPAREGAVLSTTNTAEPASVAQVHPPDSGSLLPLTLPRETSANSDDPPVQSTYVPSLSAEPYQPPAIQAPTPDPPAKQPSRGYGDPAYWNSVTPFRALVDAVGFSFGAETDGEWSQATECAKVLGACTPSFTAWDVAWLIERWGQLFPGATCTPRAIANHAGRLRTMKAPPVSRNGKHESSSDQMQRILDARRGP